MQGTMYLHVTKCLQKLELNINAFSAILMFVEGGVDVSSFVWKLRQHHEASNFKELLEVVRKAFTQLAGAHAC
eukprot:7766895-Karenia_brevis.AAC.1